MVVSLFNVALLTDDYLGIFQSLQYFVIDKNVHSVFLGFKFSFGLLIQFYTNRMLVIEI